MEYFYNLAAIFDRNSVNIPQPAADSSELAKVFTIVFTIIGALAFLMLVIAGFRYVISSGEPQKMAEIRRQIIYIAIGLIMVVLANVIVSSVLSRTS